MEHAHDSEPGSALPATAADKLLQALEMMDLGLRLKRAALARQHPDASAEELEELFRQWLLEDD